MEKIKKFLEWLIILAWFPVAIYYFYPQKIESLDKNINNVSFSNDTQWWIILYNNKKIGYSYIKYDKKNGDWFVEDFMFMKINAFGKTQTLYSKIKAKLTPDLKIDNFSFMITNPTGVNFSGEGVFENNNLNIKMNTPSGNEKIRFKINNRPYLPDVIYRVLMQKKLKAGDKYSFPVYDPILGKEMKGVVTVDKKITYRFNNMLIPAYKIKFNYSNNDVTAIISERFGVLEEISGQGFRSKRVDKNAALSPVENVNLIWSTAVPSNRIIKNKEKLKTITYKISGIDTAGFDLDGGDQSLEGDLLIIKKPEIPSKVNESIFNNYKEYLKSTPFIQVNAKPFIAITSKYLADPVYTVRGLTHWVYKYLKKEPVISVPSALEVYNLKKGDCNEHAVLLTALLRTANIPSRQAAGVVYQDGYFFYHAWVEVYLGSWIPVDPTFDQVPADVTHIRFISGDLEKQSKVLQLINKLKIEVIDYK